MASFYIKYTPARRGLTGAEYLPQFLAENFSAVTFDSVTSDGTVHYGILNGTGDELSQILSLIAGKFSAIRLTETEFNGNCYNNYNPADSGIEGETPPTFTEMMATHGITITDTVADVKSAKLNLFKEISKKKCADDNDNIADLAKCITLLNLHYPDLSTGDKAIVDAQISTLKSVYSQATCMAAFDKMVNTTLSILLSGYYTAKVSVETAADEAAVNAVTYE